MGSSNQKGIIEQKGNRLTLRYAMRDNAQPKGWSWRREFLPEGATRELADIIRDVRMGNVNTLNQRRARLVAKDGRWHLRFWEYDVRFLKWRRLSVLLNARSQGQAEREATKRLSWVNHLHRLVPQHPSKSGKAGIVYVIEAVGRSIFKVGATARKSEGRLSQLRAYCPDELRIILEIYVGDHYAAEAQLHSALATYRVRGEWFALEESRLRTILANTLTDYDVREYLALGLKPRKGRRPRAQGVAVQSGT